MRYPYNTKELEYKLHYDNLTSLLNRYSFFEDIKCIKMPLLFLFDIHKFKMINEVYGSDIGTVVLIEFANFLSKLYDSKSYKVYRLSADEFGVLCSYDDIKTITYKLFIDNFFKNLDNFFVEVQNDTITLDVTVGISKAEETYETAEIALDYAKKNNMRYMFYSTEIDKRQESSEILKRKKMIRQAIDDKRVVPVYQAIVDNSTKALKYEILMRIQKPDTDELISPYFFLDAAQKTSLYDQLSSIIIFKALAILKDSQHSLSINFAYSDIRNTKFIDEIEDYMKQNPQIGSRAVFEITEDESIKNYDDVKKFIKRFQEYGVRIAIDDFGTGFSNFEHILEIEPDYIKIDGSLIRNIDTDSRSFTLVKAIVKFSHKLGSKVIAEFVHSEIIFDMLRDLEVDEYHGYYFAEPTRTIS